MHHPFDPCKKILPSILFLMSLFLSGCGTYYNVSVDSLRSEAYDSSQVSYYLEPGNENIEEDDLLFREVARQLEPAFAIHGYQVVSNRSEAQNIARISYWEEDPEVTVQTGTRTTSQPVILRDGKKERVEYVQVEEPTVTTVTTYSAGMLIEAYEKSASGKTGKPIWRTSVTCSAGHDDFRDLLARMTPVLSRMLGTHTQGRQHFEVFVEDKGQVTVTETN